MVGAYATLAGVCAVFLSTNPPNPAALYYSEAAGHGHHNLGTHYEALSQAQPEMGELAAIHFIEAQKIHAPVFNYILTWKSPVRDGLFGACHAMDIAFVFGTLNESFWGSGSAADRFSDCIQDAWLAFARNGDPSCKSLGEWPVYGDKRIAMLLGEECHTFEMPYEEERSAWEQVPNVFGS